MSAIVCLLIALCVVCCVYQALSMRKTAAFLSEGLETVLFKGNLSTGVFSTGNLARDPDGGEANGPAVDSLPRVQNARGSFPNLFFH